MNAAVSPCGSPLVFMYSLRTTGYVPERALSCVGKTPSRAGALSVSSM
jgi:hypothetical protein